MTTTTNCYRLALAFRTHAMALVPIAQRGNELRTRLERATWSAIESSGQPTLDEDARSDAEGSVRRALMVLDVLVGESRLPRAAVEPVRRIGDELLADLSSTGRSTVASEPRGASASPRDVLRARSSPTPATRASRAPLPAPRRPRRFAWLRRELFLTLLGPSPT